MRGLLAAYVLFASASYVSAQYGGGNYGGYGGQGGQGDQGGSNSGNDSGQGGPEVHAQVFNAPMMVTAHAVLGTLAFGFLFPVGSIMVRLASFPNLWLVHGIFQILVYLLYAAGFALGIYLAMNMGVLTQAHPIIGIVLFVLLSVQPILGLLHHFAFITHHRRVAWSHGHIWLGRFVVTLGIINGGLGLQLAQASIKQILGYSIAAALMWLLYVASAIYGETKRRRQAKEGTQLSHKEKRAADETDGAVQAA